MTLHESEPANLQAPPPQPRQGRPPPEEIEGRVVVIFHPRSILTALGVLLAVLAAVELVLLARAGLTLVLIALFLALALNPAVEALQRRGLRRAAAVGMVYLLALGILVLLALVFVPPLVD